MSFSPVVLQCSSFSSVVLVLIFSLVFLVCLSSRAAKSRYPPGPASHPLIGHTLQVPAEKTWLYFEQLGKKYGPLVLFLSFVFQLIVLFFSGSIVRLSLAGDEIVVLNDVKDAEELVSFPFPCSASTGSVTLRSSIGGRITIHLGNLSYTRENTSRKASV